MRLEFFDRVDDSRPARAIDLDPLRNRTGDVWHVWVGGIRPGQLYGYRVGGPYRPHAGLRFNFRKLLLGPFATAISRLADWNFDPARGYDAGAPEKDLVPSTVDDAAAMPKCVFTHDAFDWRDDQPLRHPFAASGKGPEQSVNFVTCHDGFTLNDLVSYRKKHNEANGEENRNGSNENLSENHGIEGETHDIEIESTRKRQIKNYLLTSLISRGVPMLMGGDEFRRTQRGNSNAYCQDNETSWYDWSCVERHPDIYRFTRGMIAFRRAHPVLSKEQFYTDADIRWFDAELRLPNWTDREAKRLACLIHEGEGGALYLIFNATAEPAGFRVPPAPNGMQWYRAVDTGRESPEDFFSEGEESAFDATKPYAMTSRSSVVLLCRKGPGRAQGSTPPHSQPNDSAPGFS